jgi:hypothetical protein
VDSHNGSVCSYEPKCISLVTKAECNGYYLNINMFFYIKEGDTGQPGSYGTVYWLVQLVMMS